MIKLIRFLYFQGDNKKLLNSFEAMKMEIVC
jgi:hypothetical protein